jgi:hypothetical protein
VEEIMDKDKAESLREKVFELIALCTEYHAHFREEPPTHDSPEEAWQQSGRIHDKQLEIARMLDADSFTAPKANTAGFELFHRFMYLRLAIDMMKAACNLVIFCIKAEAAESESDREFRHTMVRNGQYVISRMLDPKVVHECVGNSK